MSDDAGRTLKRHARMRSARRLLVVLGDQLDRRSPALGELDDERDALLMVEASEEAEHVPSHRQRTALFLAAMRHFAIEQVEAGRRLRYVQLDDRANTGSLGSELSRAIETLSPECVRVVRPGEHRVTAALREACEHADVPLEILPDRSFTCSLDEFDDWAEGRKELTMEYFYRARRRALGVLLTDDGTPVHGAWNFDKQNRETFDGPPRSPAPYRARPDAVTTEVMRLVERSWPDAYGVMDSLVWPVTPAEATRALERFVDERLTRFGPYQDAMWSGEPTLWHSLLSSSINLKLLDPKACVDRAIEAYEAGEAPINSVEGFVRQLIGWREFVRGVYYREGDGYAERNGLDHHGALPDFFWTGETEMACLRHALGEVVANAYGHHIQRLMLIGNFGLIAGIAPRAVHEWFLAMYVDAVEWATAPNTIGMALHADGGVVGSKPYAASGKYVKRMSNYCDGCRFDVRERRGDDACPFNTFYWDFMIRHRRRFAKNRRMAMMLKNVDRLDDAERRGIREDARRRRDRLGIGEIEGG